VSPGTISRDINNWTRKINHLEMQKMYSVTAVLPETITEKLIPEKEK
jgi:hypothetical protein